jgi:hypothetical protein
MSEIEEEFSLRLPKDPAKMTRAERREWYHKNRKRLQLPRWGQLRETLK